MSVSVGIVGFTGYSGAEAVRILTAHPHCEPVLLEHRADSGGDAKLVRKSTIRRAPATAESIANEGLKAVFLATSPEVSMDLAPKFLAAGAIVIDLSGAFRLRTPERYKQWYKEDHTAPGFLAEAVSENVFAGKGWTTVWTEPAAGAGAEKKLITRVFPWSVRTKSL